MDDNKARVKLIVAIAAISAAIGLLAWNYWPRGTSPSATPTAAAPVDVVTKQKDGSTVTRTGSRAQRDLPGDKKGK